MSTTPGSRERGLELTLDYVTQINKSLIATGNPWVPVRGWIEGQAADFAEFIDTGTIPSDEVPAPKQNEKVVAILALFNGDAPSV